MWHTIYAAVTLTAVLSFACYAALIATSFLNRKEHADADPSSFEWHLFVPCRDEETVIGRTITDARTNFPEAHLWIIDDASVDSTAEIVEASMREDPNVHLVRRVLPEARQGKGAALNAAYQSLVAWRQQNSIQASSDRVIVGIVDADGRLAPNALSAIAGAGAFARPNVGAAQITVHMHNRNERYLHLPRVRRGWRRFLVIMQDLEFRTIVAGMQSLRARTGTVGMGGNGQFSRLRVLEELDHEFGTPWHGSLLEDYEMGVHVLLRGWQSAHVHSTHVTQEAVEDLPRLLTQRTRWAQGNIQCLLYLRRMRNSIHISPPGVLETAYYLLLPYTQIIVIVFWGVQLCLTFTEVVGQGINVSAAPGEWAMKGALIMLGLIPFAMWGPIYRKECEPEISVAASIMLGGLVFVYTLYVMITTPRAMIRAARRKTSWSKTRRNAENLTVGGIAHEL